ncbi:MAG: Trk system potassium transporter TrkA [Alphaproteobacteria bacterium]|nr:Trk system potassium transporter TrkA [Alphaproteobacteria bacterium]MBF0249077.1 Trk system potassium transporter TrkA [Alphaproteobacteria bacterium]
MKVIVCGAGQVGFHIAQHLSRENNDITVIDQSPELIRRVTDTLDVQGVIGHASRPDILERAGANDCDMIIAVTAADEANMVACQVAHSLFDVPTKIARIRAQAYLQPMWSNLFSRQHMPIDVIISPEIEVARAIQRRLSVPGAYDMIPLVGGRVRLLGIRCGQACPLVNTPLRQLSQLFPDLSITVIGIVRNGKFIVPDADSQMMVGDGVYFIVATDKQDRAMAAFGHEEKEARRIVLLGGGNIGLFLAEELEACKTNLNIKLIEWDAERAAYCASRLDKTTVIQGDVLDMQILEEANIAQTEAVIAVTNDDENNILSSLLAKREGAKRAITLINKGAYEALSGSLGIDVVVDPRNITVSTIIQHVRRGRIHSAHTLGEGFGELIEAEALETSPMVGKPLMEAKLPDGLVIGAVVRGEEVISPRGATVINAGDRVVVFAAADIINQVEKMFSVQLEYF